MRQFTDIEKVMLNYLVKKEYQTNKSLIDRKILKQLYDKINKEE